MHSFLQVIVKRLVSIIRLQNWGLIGCIHNEIYGNSTTKLQDTMPPSIVKMYPEKECQCSCEVQSMSEKASRPPCEPLIMGFKSFVPFK